MNAPIKPNLTALAQACIDAKREADQWTKVYEQCKRDLAEAWDGQATLGTLSGGVIRWRQAHERLQLDTDKARALMAVAGIPIPEKVVKVGAGPTVEVQK